MLSFLKMSYSILIFLIFLLAIISFFLLKQEKRVFLPQKQLFFKTEENLFNLTKSYAIFSCILVTLKFIASQLVCCLAQAKLGLKDWANISPVYHLVPSWVTNFVGAL
jgi:hypothetical protein